MHIAPAAATDVPALSDLLTALFSQEAEFTPDQAAQRRGVSHIIANPDSGTILLARQGDQVIGMVNLLFTISTALGEPVALLEDMVVAPAGRGSGVGTQLLSAAIAAARARGCKRITLLTDRANEAAQRIYARQGFVASGMLPMRLMLG